MDVSNEYERKETPSHSEQIKAKLNRWKSNNSKIAAVPETIDTFFKPKIKHIDNIQKKNVEELLDNNVKELTENNVCNSPLKGTDTIEINSKDENIDGQKQENIKSDKKNYTFINNSKSKNIELTECSFNNSNSENTDDHKFCLNNVSDKFDAEVDIKYDSIKMNDVKNVSVEDDTNIYYDSSKTKTDVSIEIDTSIAPKERKFAVVETNLEIIKQRLRNLRFRKSEKQKSNTRFYATIDPSKNQQAEGELSREISKDMFSKVSICIIIFFKYIQYNHYFL